MQKRVCIIDLSAPEIRGGMITDDGFEARDELTLPWEVGFQQAADGTLSACFGEAFDRLDSNRPTEVRLTELDVHLKEITDAPTLECLFRAFLAEIFHRRLPQETMSVYVITPYQWKFVHRQQLRKAFKDIERPGFNASNAVLRSCLTQSLCLAFSYQEAWQERLAALGELQAFLFHFSRHDLTRYHLICEQEAAREKVELRDIRRYPDFFMDTEKPVSELLQTLKKMGTKHAAVVGFSGAIATSSSSAVMKSLQTRCSATFLEPQEDATLLGGAELARQFETNSLEKPLHFTYHFCFGVRLPGGRWVELIPKAWAPPCQRKKAFRVRGTLAPFDMHLFCGLSLTDSSDVHHLATLALDISANNKNREFVLSVALSDSIHGTFAVHLPEEREPQNVAFTVPVLMD